MSDVEARLDDRDELLSSFIDFLRLRHPEAFDVSSSSSTSPSSIYEMPSPALEDHLTGLLLEGDLSELSFGLQWAAIVILPFLRLTEQEKVEAALAKVVAHYLDG